MKKYEIRVEYVTNDWRNVDRVYDYAGKEFGNVMDAFNVISNHYHDMMKKGEIKTYTASLAC